MTSLRRWQELWGRLGAAESSDVVFESLLAAHAEPQRYYHTAQHLTECFARLTELRATAERPDEIELALWFHDGVYNTTHKDNEERSAAWARETALANGLSAEVVDRIVALILMTRHSTVTRATDSAVIVDCDLGILAAPRERFDEYERQIREEYAWVPAAIYKFERRKVLRGFTSRQWIYSTELFRRLHEARARENIARASRAL